MNTEQKTSSLDRFLNIFTQVNAGEGGQALLLALNIFLIMTSYYIMKPVREALILAGGGAVIKSYASAGQVTILLFAVPLYGMIANKFPRRKLINFVTFFFIACLIVFYILALVRVPIGVIFFLWIGIFNLMIPAQFWAFANDLYIPENGKRIFVIIAFGASLGAVLGGVIAEPLIEPLGVYQLLLIAGAILVVSLLLTNYIDAKSRNLSSIRAKSPGQEVTEQGFKSKGSFKLVFKTRYLLLIALQIMFINWINTNGEFILGLNVEKTAEKQALQESQAIMLEIEDSSEKTLGADSNSLDETGEVKREEFIQDYKQKYIGKFYARFFTYVNLASLLLQLFIVSRIIKFLGIRVALLILPLIAFGGYFIMAFIPILAIIRPIKIAENSTDYSLQNTVRQILFLPTTRDEKYKAKQAIDTFFWRAGDLLSTAVVIIGSSIAFHTKHFALINVALVLVWFVIAYYIGKENRKLVVERQVKE